MQSEATEASDKLQTVVRVLSSFKMAFNQHRYGVILLLGLKFLPHPKPAVEIM